LQSFPTILATVPTKNKILRPHVRNLSTRHRVPKILNPHQNKGLARAQARSISTSHSKGGYLEEWPRSKSNTIINVCPQGHRMIVERLGKLQSIKNPGFFIAIPGIDTIAYIIDMREKAIEIEPQMAITKDNVSLLIAGNVFVEFNDPIKAAYGSFNPLYAVKQNAQSSMRAAIGHLELDEILHAREKINNKVHADLVNIVPDLGLKCKRYEITEITPDKHIADAMDKQAAAERSRREQIKGAEGDKQSAVLKSEGFKIKLINESEGEMIRITNEAEANKQKTLLAYQAEAEGMLEVAKAEALSIELLAAAMSKPNGDEAARLRVADEYIKMYGEMGKASNTMIFSQNPADMNSLMAQAASVFDSAKATRQRQVGRASSEDPKK
jgi:regulator of protease activity HflC (stomatin/prohibitin superfamily)